MRLSGAKLSDIAEIVWGPGTHARTAGRAIARLLEETAQEPADHLRNLEIARLDRMMLALWSDVLDGKWLAHDRVLKIMERKAALMGLDAPQKRIVEVITPEALAEALETERAEVERLRARLAVSEADAAIDVTALDDQVRKELEQGEAEMVARATTIQDADVIEPDSPLLPDEVRG